MFGPGLDNERGGRHDNPRVIAAWAYATAGNLADLQPSRTPDGRQSVGRLTELLEQPVRICRTPLRLPVWHCSIHNHPDDPILTDQEWQHIATDVAAAVGLAPSGDLSAVRWVGIRHAEGHIHLVATLARQDRRAVWAWQDYRRAQACCRELEEHYSLHRVGGRHAPEHHPKPAELNKTTRQQRDEVPRHSLRRLVHATADTARDEQDFLDRLRTSGLLVRPRAGCGCFAAARPAARRAGSRWAISPRTAPIAGSRCSTLGRPGSSAPFQCHVSVISVFDAMVSARWDRTTHRRRRMAIPTVPRRVSTALLISVLVLLGLAIPAAAQAAPRPAASTTGVTPLDQTSFCNPGPPRDCWVFDPVVTVSAQAYPSIQISAGDRVTIDAGGCVQTGGKGLTWKRYVDPIASNGLYHGSILIPGMDGLVQLQFMVGQTVVAGAFGFLVLGYQDDGYADNGYYAHDNGTSNQCRDLGDAWVHLIIN